MCLPVKSISLFSITKFSRHLEISYFYCTCCVHSQIQFEEWQDSKMCNIIINDDSLYEGTETFSVEIFQPIYTLLGRKNRATVSILDSEDGGSIVFLKYL